MTRASSFRDYATDLGHWWKVQRERRHDIAALRSMGLHEIDELSGELGLSRAQLEDLVRAGPDAAAELERMIAALGLDPDTIQASHPAAMREMKALCATCGEKRTCRHALGEGTAAPRMASFCPNADELADIARQP